MKKYFCFFVLFLLLPKAVFSYEIIWPMEPDIAIKKYIIRVSQHSREYVSGSFSKIEVDNLTEIGVDNLPLYPNASNFVSVSFIKDGREVSPSEEIVLFRIGENQIDSDKDGLADDFEKEIGTNPRKADSDEDGIPDGEELATWGVERVKNKIDFDEDGTPNIIDPDSDNDGILDGSDSDIRRIYFFYRYQNKGAKEKDKKFVSLKKNEKGEVVVRTPELKLFWSKVPDKNLDGYLILYGTESGKYDHVIDVGLTRTPENPQTSITITTTVDKWQGKREITFYITCVAYDGTKSKSDPSKEVVYSMPNPYFKPQK